MNSGLIEFFAFAALAVVSGLFLLVSMVRELAPNERRKWLLGIGLGTGIIAFSLKIGLIVIFSLYPGPMLSLFPERKLEADVMGNSIGATETAIARKESYTWQALPESAPFPWDNPPSAEKIALGKRLFFDKRLSADGSLSCASCHELSDEKGGSDGISSSIGIDGQQGNRNAPTVLNAAFQRRLFWDGRAASLEEQAIGPLLNPIEMGVTSIEVLVEKVQTLPEYRKDFLRVFGAEPAVSADNIVKAIAAFERTLITPNSPYDRFVKGESGALTDKQLRGMALFESVGCVLCHSGPNFSGASLFGDNTPYRIFPTIPGTEYEERYRLAEDLGAAANSGDSDRGVWRIPSLRNVNRTAPYFHNGSVGSLEEAVRIMARVQLDKKLSNHTPDDAILSWQVEDRRFRLTEQLALSDTEVDEIVAFLQALDGELP
jgi:cytochrome c peroxidase